MITPRPLGRVAMLATAALLGGAASAQAAVEVQSVTAQAIANTSPCTAEAKAEYNNNTTYNPANPTIWFGADNAPSIDDLVPATQAGDSADFCVGYTLTPDFDPNINRVGSTPAEYGTFDPATQHATGDDQRNIVVTLPAGYLANLKDAGECTNADFGKDGLDFPDSDLETGEPGPENGYANCDISSRVGDAVVRLSTSVLGVHTPVGDDAGPGTTLVNPPSGAIFNLERGPNELGRLGVQIFAPLGQDLPAKFVVRLTLAPDGSGRVRATVLDAPRFNYYTGFPGESPARDMYIESVTMRMWGSKAAHPTLNADFGETGTSCAAATPATVNVTTYGGNRDTPTNALAPVQSQMSSTPQTLTGCDQLPFTPSVDITPSTQSAGAPTGLTVDVNLDQSTSGLRTALLKDAAVTLPEGLELGAQAGSGPDGLQLCSAAQFDVASPLTPNACDTATEAGTVEIDSPLVADPLVGKVYLGEQEAVGTLPRLYVEASFAGATASDAPRIKLVGEVSADDDGRLTTTFENNPQLRFSRLRLVFPGGDNALFVNPLSCGTHTGDARMTPWSGAAAVSVPSSIEITDDCDTAFAPGVSVSSADGRVSSSAAQTITLTRPDRAAWLTGATIHLPAGLLADLNAASECGAAAAATGACSAASRIGTVSTSAGAGSDPLSLPGEIFLTERQGDDTAGAVIVVPAKIGDLDLGKVVVPGRIRLRPTDAGLDFITTIPTRFAGVALHLRSVAVELNRESFPLSPSACGPLAYSAELSGTAGASAVPSGQVSYTGCAELPFTPQLKAILTGDNTPGGHPGMYVVLTSPQGNAGMKTAAVTLPQGVVADLANTRTVCDPAQFEVSNCPENTKIGTATASVSIVPEPLTGDIFMVRVPGKSLPGLGLVFKGRYPQRVLSTVTTDAQSRLVTTFPSIPDLPLRRLVVDVTSSARSPLQISEREPCEADSGWQGVFTGQGGQSATSKTGLQCAATPKIALSDRGGLSFRLFDFGTRKLSYAKVTLPKGWRLSAAAAKRKNATWTRLTGGKGTLRITSRSVTVFATGSPTDVRFKVLGAVVSRSAGTKPVAKVTLPVRLAFTDGTIQEQSVVVTTRR